MTTFENHAEWTEGSLKIRIEGPQRITQTGVWAPVQVVVENIGAEAVSGRIAAKVIAPWRIKPAGASFRVDAGQKCVASFLVLARPGIYNAHYPVHAFVRFSEAGKRFNSHTRSLIIETQIPNPPVAERCIPWKPVSAPRRGGLMLWRMPVHKVLVTTAGGHVDHSIGWVGRDEVSAAGLRLSVWAERGPGREALDLDAPREGGSTVIEIPLQLHETRPVRVMTAVACSDGSEGRLIFRVRALPFESPERVGEVLAETSSAGTTWQSLEADLARFAGRAIRLQLEIESPGGGTGHWAEPTVVAGERGCETRCPPVSSDGSFILGQTRVDGALHDVRIWKGEWGLLDAVIGFEGNGRQLYCDGFRVCVASSDLVPWRCQNVLLGMTEEKGNGLWRLQYRFSSWMGDFGLTAEARIVQGVFQVELKLTETPPATPWLCVRIQDVITGPWSDSVRRLYIGTGNVLDRPGLLQLHYDGHCAATSYIGMDFDGGLSLVLGTNGDPTLLRNDPAKRECSYHASGAQTITFIPASNAWAAVLQMRTVLDPQPAAGVTNLAGRFCYDIWWGKYREGADRLRWLFRYGMTDAVAIWHVWQRWGYDVRIPDIWPPDPRKGSLRDMQYLVRSCRERGVLFAPHDNYTDYYPDADGFLYEDVGYDENGAPLRAWPGQVQSYVPRYDRHHRFLDRNLTRVKKALNPGAYFVDVCSSVQPGEWWSRDGRCFERRFTRNAWGRFFDRIRGILENDAPTLSESGHDALVGHLDGAQCNHLAVFKEAPTAWGAMGWIVPCEDWEHIPWMDAVYHESFVLLGSGGLRHRAGRDGRVFGDFGDEMLCTTVLTGHSPIVLEYSHRDAVRLYWLLQNFGRAMALRRMESCSFDENNIHRFRIEWSGEARVWVNRDAVDWNIPHHVLPQYGFYASVPVADGVVEAVIERRDGVTVEWSRAPRELFFNARPASEYFLPVQAAVLELRRSGQQLRLCLKWNVRDALPEDFGYTLTFLRDAGRRFCHTVRDPVPLAAGWSGTFEATHEIAIPEEHRAAGTALDVRLGICSLRRDALVAMEGYGDGDDAIRLGTINLTGAGSLDWRPVSGPDPFLDRINSACKLVDFGPVVTDGAFRMTLDGPSLVITPLPEMRKPFTVRIKWQDLPWELARPTRIRVLDEKSRPAGRADKVVEANGVYELRVTPGVFSYRLE